MFRILMVLGASAGLVASAAAADLPEIKERGVLRIAYASLSPFVIREASGRLSGFEIDATSALGAHLGVDVQYIEKPFCQLADAVVNGEADMIASGYSNTPARRRILDFSLPYHDTEYYAVVAKDVAKKARTLTGLNTKDVAIGYQEGGVSGDVAKGDFSGSDLKGFTSFTDIVNALESGELDGAVMFAPYDKLVTRMKTRRFTVPHEFPLTRTIEAYAVEQGADELREALNEWVMERDLEGYWDALEEKWFDPENAMVSTPPPFRCPGQIPVQ